VNDSAADAGAECDHCGRDIVGRVVTLELDGNHRRRFCSDGCEVRWTRAELIRVRRFVRRIWMTSRGSAMELARRALLTDDPP
jgi:hypothetical protein